MSNTFTASNGKIEKSEPNGCGGSRIPRRQAIDEVARTFTFLAFTLDEEAISARDILEESELLQEHYDKPNAIGDVAGLGRKGHNIGLSRQKGAYPCTRQNVQRALQVLSQTALDSLLTKLDMDLEKLIASLTDFPSE